MRAYPQPELKAVRTTWNALRQAYVDRASADRPARFAAADPGPPDAPAMPRVPEASGASGS